MMACRTPRRGMMVALVALVACATLVVACGGDRGADDMAAGLDSAALATSGASEADMLADQQIVTQVGASNAAEIAVSKLAADRATSAEVRSFAGDMVNDHQKLQGELDSLSMRLGIAAVPEQDDTLQAAFDRRREELQGASAGADWDRSFMDLQVGLHESALDLLNGGVASAHGTDLRNLLQQAVPVVQAHLDRARQLLTAVGGPPAG